MAEQTQHVRKQAHRAPQPAAPAKEAPRGRYVTALDGLRALCVVGVVFYHMNLSWCQGGLLGVTVLFVLSGYLVTCGLRSEFRRNHGKIDLPAFWLRRVRRVMPSVVVFLVVTAATLTVFNHVLLTKMRGDVIPALLMVLNWTKILGNESYFAAAGQPSPLTHFWSLAIEMQFYLIWPPILYLLMRKRVPQKPILVGLGVLSIVSAVLMAVLYDPMADPSRPYYGTDTRAMSLFIGCALAFVWPMDRMSEEQADGAGGQGRIVFEAAAGISVVALLVMMVITKGYTSFSYYGGILLVSVVSAVAVWALVPQGTIVSQVLSLPPLAWVGQRSFALYLWHYPVVELLLPANSTSGISPVRVILAFAISLVLAELSYRFIEQPMRKQGMLPALKQGLDDFLAGVRGLASGRSAEPRQDEDELDEREGRRRRSARGQASAKRGSVAPGFIRSVAAVAVTLLAVGGLIFVPPVSAAGGLESEERISQASLKKPVQDGVYDVVLIGDSVALTSYDELVAAFPHGLIDAAISRQAQAALDIFIDYRDQGVVGDTVIFSVGTNGALTEDILESIVEAVGEERTLWLVNNRMPDPFQDENNRLIAECAERHENVHVIDWYGHTAGHDEYFEPDGTHPNYASRNVFPDLMVEAIGYEAPTDENTRYDPVLIGDTVPLSAADELASALPRGVIDCATGRNAAKAAETYANYEEQGTVGSDVVFAVSSTGPMTQADVDALVEAVGDGHAIWFVTARVPEGWDEETNALLRKAADEHSNVHVIDWYEASEGHDEYLDEDGTHLTSKGAEAYAELISEAL